MFKLNYLAVLLATALFATLIPPVFAVTYNPGVTTGQYVKYGNFVGVGPGAESFNDYDWLKLQVTDVSGKSVTLLSTGQFKNGTTIAGNGTVLVWNIETGTEDNIPSTQGPIIAANLNTGEPIPPPDTYSVNRTESRTYLGTARTVNILDASISTPDYNTTLTYIYDKASGMLLESRTQTTTQAEPQPIVTIISYSVVETNIFSSSNPLPFMPDSRIIEIGAIAIVILIGIIIALALTKRRK